MGHSQPMPWAQRQSDEVIGVGSHVRVGGVGAITVVFVVNLPVRRFAREDAAGLRAELASLESMGLLTQSEVARSGLVPEATFHRDCAAFRAGGEAAVRARTVRGSRGPRKLLPAVLLEIKRLRAEGLTQAVIGQRLGMSTRTVIHALSTGEDAPTAIAPLTRPGTESAAEPAIEAVRGEGEDALAETESAVAEAQDIKAERPAADADACTRRVAQQRADEWTLARLGQIEEQSALFPPIERARFGGVLRNVSTSVRQISTEISRDPGCWLRSLEFSWDQPSRRASPKGCAISCGHRRGSSALSPGPSPAAKLQERGAPAGAVRPLPRPLSRSEAARDGRTREGRLRVFA